MGWIYHEKQVSSLCGQHCLNNLLQLSCYTAPDLAEIAQDLDRRERQLMLEAGDATPDVLKFLAEDSGNVDEAGNFSVQVLSEALTRSHGLRLVNAGSDDIKGKLSTTGYDKEPGFVCNRQSHWLTIRNINGKYYNLNSTADAPERITTFALEATLYQYRADGYSVFLVRKASEEGSSAVRLPEPDPSGPNSGGDPADWYNEADLTAGGVRSKIATLASGAAAAAVGTAESAWAKLGSGQRLDGGAERGTKRPAESSRSAVQLSEDDEIAQAIALSLAEQQDSFSQGSSMAAASHDPVARCTLPPEPAADALGAIRVMIRMPTERVVRRFIATDSALQLWAFVASSLGGASSSSFDLLGPGSRPLDLQAVVSKQSSFSDENLGGSSVIVRLR